MKTTCLPEGTGRILIRRNLVGLLTPTDVAEAISKHSSSSLAYCGFSLLDSLNRWATIHEEPLITFHKAHLSGAEFFVLTECGSRNTTLLKG